MPLTLRCCDRVKGIVRKNDHGDTVLCFYSFIYLSEPSHPQGFRLTSSLVYTLKKKNQKQNEEKEPKTKPAKISRLKMDFKFYPRHHSTFPHSLLPHTHTRSHAYQVYTALFGPKTTWVVTTVVLGPPWRLCALRVWRESEKQDTRSGQVKRRRSKMRKGRKRRCKSHNLCLHLLHLHLLHQQLLPAGIWWQIGVRK